MLSSPDFSQHCLSSNFSSVFFPSWLLYHYFSCRQPSKCIVSFIVFTALLPLPLVLKTWSHCPHLLGLCEQILITAKKSEKTPTRFCIPNHIYSHLEEDMLRFVSHTRSQIHKLCFHMDLLGVHCATKIPVSWDLVIES